MLKNMTFINKIILTGLLSFAPLFALEEANLQNEMKRKIDNITSVLQNPSFSSAEKEANISPTVDTVFDYKTMSKISLGKKWKTLSTTQQEEFSQKFEAKLKNSYFEKLELYTNEKVLVKEKNKVKSNRIHLHTEIVGTEESYEIIYKFYKVKNTNDWLIYDIDITGVSIIQTYRKQFAEFLASKSFDELLASL